MESKAEHEISRDERVNKNDNKSDKYIHKCKLMTCLSCLKYHIYEDGVPMKKRQYHKYKQMDIIKFRGE